MLDAALANAGLTVERDPLLVMLGIGWRRALILAQGSAPGRALRRFDPRRILPALVPTAPPAGEQTHANDQVERVELLYTGVLGLSLFDGVLAASFQARHLLAAIALGDPARLLRALYVERSFVASRGTAARDRTPALERQIADLIASRETHVSPSIAGLELGSRGQVAFFEGDFAGAVAAVDRAERLLLARGHEVGAELLQLRLYRLWAWVWLGDLNALRDSVGRLMREARRHGNLLLARALAVEGGALIALADDRPEDAIARADEVLAEIPKSSGPTVAWFNAWVARVHAALYVGRPEEAWQRVTESWSALRRGHYWSVQVTRVEAWMIRGRAALASGRLDEARTAIARLTEEGADYARALATFISAGAAWHAGATEQARALTIAARDGLQTTGLALFASATHVPPGSSGDPSALTALGIAKPARMAQMLWGVGAGVGRQPP